jgi:hypothetical protein
MTTNSSVVDYFAETYGYLWNGTISSRQLTLVNYTEDPFGGNLGKLMSY